MFDGGNGHSNAFPTLAAELPLVSYARGLLSRFYCENGAGNEGLDVAGCAGWSPGGGACDAAGGFCVGVRDGGRGDAGTDRTPTGLARVMSVQS
jgi:hypothetical protein